MEVVAVNSKESFDSAVLGSALPVVADFMAPWCGYCKRIAPVVDRLAEKFDGKVIFVKIDTDAAPELGEQYKIDIVPTFFLFKNGEHGQSLIAPKSQEEIEEWMKSQAEI